MKAAKGKPNRGHLYSIYQRVKNNCHDEWRVSRESFYSWYENRIREQKGLCEYCHLPGDTTKYYRSEGFRKGRRGFNLEVDRKDAQEQYSPENCVLACYPCNNAKSDVFSYEEFLKIGEAIGKAKKKCLEGLNKSETTIEPHGDGVRI